MSNKCTNDNLALVNANPAFGHPLTAVRARLHGRSSRAMPLLLVPWLLAACGADTKTAVEPAVVMAQPVYAASAAQAGLAVRYAVEATPRYQTPLSFRVGGKILERDAALGDRVHKGQVLARLDPQDAQRQADTARAALEAAEHRLAYARQQLDRDSRQAAQSLIAASALEQTQDAYSAALADRERAVDQRVIAENALHYHTLTADRDGVITAENAEAGQYVAAGQSVFGLAWSGDVDVVLDAAASDVSRIAVGQSAAVTFTALPDRRYDARVREIAPVADPQSRTYRVKFTLAGAAPDVRLGMTGYAEWTPPAAAAGAAPASLFQVPATAVFHQAASPAVWVVRSRDSTLELRPVAVASYTADSALIAAGLRDGDNVVQAGVHTVFAGEKVTAVKPLYADAAAGAGGRP